MCEPQGTPQGGECAAGRSESECPSHEGVGSPWVVGDHGSAKNCEDGTAAHGDVIFAKLGHSIKKSERLFP